jgi:membrane protein DedA with SNARE-associated domain
MLDYLLNAAGDHGYLGLTTASFLHGAGLPIPVEMLLVATLALVHQQKVKYIPALLLISASDSLGIFIPYSIGRWGATPRVRRYIEVRKQKSRWVQGTQQYGALTVLITRIIGFMRYACLLMSGTIGLPFWQVAAATFIGCTFYNLVGSAVVELGWRVVKYYGLWTLIPIIVVVILLIRRRRALAT